MGKKKETMGNKQKEVLKTKDTVTEMKNVFDAFY